MHIDTQFLSWAHLLIVSLVVGLGTAMAPQTAQAQDTYVVTSTGDGGHIDDCTSDGSGSCTLRAALQAANSDSDTDVIEFDVPTTGGFAKITPNEALEITEPVTIDGTTQSEYPSSVDGPVIEIDGSNLPGFPPENGFMIGASDVTISGLAVNYAPNSGLQINSGATGVTIEDCFVGIAPDDGVSDRGNNYRGIAVNGNDFSLNNNVISHNDFDGVYIDASDGIAANNKIGLDHDGDAAAGNGRDGVRIAGGSSNAIGLAFFGSTAPNFISANAEAGVRVESSGNNILVNRIGTDSTGTTTTGTEGNNLGNGNGGILVLAGNTEILNNTVSGNSGDGISIGESGAPADSNTVSNNNVGVDANADFTLPNSDDGVDVREGSGTTIDGNVIGGNASTGIEVNAVNSNVDARTVITGNYVGTNSSGADLGNAYDGLEIAAAPTSGNREIEIFGENIIGHNGDHGIELLGGEHDIAGNYIGTNASGDDLGNEGDGVEVDGVDGVSIGAFNINAQEGEDEPNVVGFNGGHGVDIVEGNDNLVWGNYIGTNENDNDLGNGSNGIRIVAGSGNSADENRIGYRAHSTVPGDPSPANNGAGNVIANNGRDGVVITGAGEPVGNSVRGNLISGNGHADHTDIGIDLGSDGTTSNDNAADDADSGPNNHQNFPVIENVDHDESTDEVAITYRVQTATGNAAYPLKVDFYAADSEASGEGAVYLGTQEYGSSDARSSVTNVIDLGSIPEVTKDDHFVATATDANGNTSEFTSEAEPLPVELVSFEATRNGDEAVHLTWQTASETNNAGFEVEHKPEGADSFEQVDFIEGAGTTGEAQSYRYAVKDVETGAHVFRLKQIDHDGAHEYSPEVEVTVAMSEAYEVTAPYPNPAHGQAEMKLAVRERQPVTVTLYNALGQRVRILYDGTPAPEATNTLTVDGSRLASGLYLVRVEGERFNTTETVTFVK